MNIYLTVAIILILLSLIMVPVMKRVVVNSVENALLNQDLDAFDKRINKWYIRFFIAPFNQDFLKLNRALMGGDKEEIDHMFDHFDEVKLNEKQKDDVYLRGFEYYLSEDDMAKTDKYYKLIKDLGNQDVVNYVERLYDIYVLKGWTYLDEMLAHIDEGPKGQQLECYSLIAAMYENKGEEEKAQEYLKIIETEFNDMMAR